MSNQRGEIWIRWLLGGITSAFLVWAAAVWNVGAEAMTILRQVESTLQRIQAEINAHEKLPWHHGIADHVLESERIMSVSRSRLERLEADHQKMLERLR